MVLECGTNKVIARENSERTIVSFDLGSGVVFSYDNSSCSEDPG
ncbi:hypothetical protein AYI70_g1670, partial [Smittium culicis]